MALSGNVLAETVSVNGRSVSLEANKTPIDTVKNSQAIAQLPAGYRFAHPGQFTVAVAGSTCRH